MTDQNNTPDLPKDYVREDASQKALAENEKKFRTIFEEAADSLVIIDPQTHKIIDFNEKAHANLGYTRAEFGKLRLEDLEAVESSADISGHVEKILRESGDSFDTKLRDKNGDLRDFAIKVRPISIDEKQCLLGIWSDITERKSLERELREAEELNRLVLSNISDAVFMTNDSGEFTYVCPNTNLIFGYNAEDALSLGNVHKLLGDISIDLEKLEKFGEIENLELDIVDRFGKNHSLLVNVKRANIKGGTRLYTCRDITRRKKAEEEKIAALDLLKKVVESMPLAIFLKDVRDLRFKMFNCAAEDLAGLKADDVIGKTDYDLVPKEQADFFAAKDRQVLESLAPVHIEEEELETPHRGARILRTTKAPVLNQKGEPEYLLGITEDITDQKKAEDRLRETTALMRYIIENDPNAIAVYDRRLNYIAVSNRYLEDYNVKEEDIIGKHHYEVFPEIPQRWKDVHQRCMEGAIESNDDDCFERPDGSITYNRWECRPWYDSKGDIRGIITYTEVTTERKLAEKALQESEAKFRRLFESSANAHVLYDHDGYFDCNESTIEILGLSSKEDLISAHPKDISPEYQPDGRSSSEKTEDILKKVFAQGSHRFDWVCLKKDGTPIYLDVLCNKVSLQGKQVIHAVWRDMTEQKIAEDKIKKSLAEKEVLLREIHHRVKNNLASISSLLTLHSHHADNDLLTQELNKARDRIRSMAVAHQLLYQSENLASIDIEHYLRNVIEHLTNSIAGLGSPISVEAEIAEVSFNIDTAIPLGFILTELVTNCLKHAFPDHGKGKINISLRPLNNENYELIVADDGRGLPDGIDLENPVSLGLELVNIFVDQLTGKMEISCEKGGTEVRVNFMGSVK